jgi:mannose-6-phosphate isomerase-like protein (cupin superfamily)
MGMTDKKGKKKGFNGDIEEQTTDNKDFRRVIYTAKYSQLVLMTLKPGEEIGMEAHDDGDQFFRFEEGNGRVHIDGHEYEVEDGSAVVIPSGALHNVTNTGKKDLKMYTIYSPPEHRDKVVHKTKAAAEADNEHFDGKTTE